ncbi:MAG: hypothetical protein IPG93_17375 [Burkholderiales bacterium]|nr:hypothetical protein [Burkholderiales bacterium]
MSSSVFHHLRSTSRPLGRLAVLWMLLFALLPLAQAAWSPAANLATNWDQVCVASIDGTPHVMAGSVGPAGDVSGDLTHMGPDCQLCPQCVLGSLALPTTDVDPTSPRAGPHGRHLTTLAGPATRLARHSAQPRAPPQA